MVKIYKIALLTFLWTFWPAYLFAATFSFYPHSSTQNVGSTFTLDVSVESSDQAMNAASTTISFPKDKLEVVSVSKAGSIFSLWVQEPSFSNSSGTITFEGIVLNPGFKGESAKIISVTFRAKQEGGVNIKFLSGSILANDGTGVNILTSPGAATINIKAKQVKINQESPDLIKKDTTKPEPFEIVFPEGKIAKNTYLPILFSASDSSSGISYYVVKVDDQREEIVQPSLSDSLNSYLVPSQYPGDHTVTVVAFDRAGNSEKSSAWFTSMSAQIPVKNDVSESGRGNRDIRNGFVLKYHVAIIIVLIVLQVIVLVKLMLFARHNKYQSSNNQEKLKNSLNSLNQDIKICLNRLRAAKFDRALTKEEELFIQTFSDISE